MSQITDLAAYRADRAAEKTIPLTEAIRRLADALEARKDNTPVPLRIVEKALAPSPVRGSLQVVDGLLDLHLEAFNRELDKLKR